MRTQENHDELGNLWVSRELKLSEALTHSRRNVVEASECMPETNSLLTRADFGSVESEKEICQSYTQAIKAFKQEEEEPRNYSATHYCFHLRRPTLTPKVHLSTNAFRHNYNPKKRYCSSLNFSLWQKFATCVYTGRSIQAQKHRGHLAICTFSTLTSEPEKDSNEKRRASSGPYLRSPEIHLYNIH